MKIADAMLIGGGMAYTFLKAQGLPIGKSLVEEDKLDLARKILADAKAKKLQALAARRSRHRAGIQGRRSSENRRCDRNAADQMGLDIGPKTIAAYSAEIAKAKTIVWNGPMGVFEMPASRKARWKSPKRSPPPPAQARLRSSAEAIPSPQFTSLASPTRFPTFPPAAALRSNFWAAQDFPASKP